MSKSIYLLLLALLLVLLLGAAYLAYTAKNLPKPAPTPTPGPVPTQAVSTYLRLVPKRVADGENSNIELYVSPQTDNLKPLGVIVLNVKLEAGGAKLVPKASAVTIPDTITRANGRASFNRIVGNPDGSVSAEFNLYSMAPEGFTWTGETLIATVPVQVPSGAGPLTLTIDPTPDNSEGMDKTEGKIEFMAEGQPIAVN